MAKKLSYKDIALYEDEEYIIVNKPPHVSTLSERQGDAISILDLIRTYWPSAQMCHRIDKETSGILVAAKHPEAYRHLSMQFEHREVGKLYRAMVEGVHSFDEHMISLPLSITSKGLARIDMAGKEAITMVKSIEGFLHHTLVSCIPLTGRLHQIRIHMSAQGAPLVSDTAYGGKHLYLSSLKKKFNMKKWEEEQPLMNRAALHAFRITFDDRKGNRITQEAAYPKDFQALLTQLKNYDQK